MERNYTEEELRKLKVVDLKAILRNQGLKVSGLKQELVDRILDNQEPEQLVEKIEKLSIQDPFALLALPKDVQRETLLKLNYRDIAQACNTNKELSKICSEDYFWQQFAERRGLKKDLPTDTWKQTAISDYLGKENYTGDSRYFLNKISWDISVMPKNTPDQDRLDIEKNRWNKYGILMGGSTMPPLPPEMIGIAVSYYDKELDKVIPLTEKDLKKIIFRQPVKIGVPSYGEIRFIDIADEHEYVENIGDEIHTFILKPNTPVGSTIGHLLEQIYRHIFGLKDNEPLKSIAEISVNPDFYVSHSTYEGLRYPDKDYDFYEILLAS